ncbi:calpain-like protein [Fusarium bulbicola]|nr:calpain-like protein [Fusarium bulbicola]
MGRNQEGQFAAGFSRKDTTQARTSTPVSRRRNCPTDSATDIGMKMSIFGWDSLSVQKELPQQIDRDDKEGVYRKTHQSGSKAISFAQCRDRNETWVPLFEKAFAKAHGDYVSLIGGWFDEGIKDFSGGVTTELLASGILDIDEL